MDAVYHCVGVIVVWACIASIATVALYWLWQHRPKNAFTRRVGNAWTWLTVFVFGRRWLLPLEGARLLLTVDKVRKLDRWERDTFAFMIRYSHRKGWAAPR